MDNNLSHFYKIILKITFHRDLKQEQYQSIS